MKYVEAKIDGKWIVVDEVKATEYNIFIICDEDGNETTFKMSEHEMRIVPFEI